MAPLVRIGTRRSKLALTQSGMMQRAIGRALGVADADLASAVPLVEIVTTGDRVQDRRLMEIGGKALFTKEIEEALLDRRVDVAVHSMKDMPAGRSANEAKDSLTKASRASSRGWAPPPCGGRPRRSRCGPT